MKGKYFSNKDALIDIFGTPSPSLKAIAKWRLSWRESNSQVQVDSFAAATRMMKENDIDPLFYQFYSAGDELFVVFYYDEHEVFFKLHYNIA